ncbi:hypothetical protein [Cognatishimia sp. WU-CL00825]|uniref:hypothetical protein n=1 Tax=Cognatishimia sp. WU-CL00825 TaxID=3127658 RepID=UPI0033655656
MKFLVTLTVFINTTLVATAADMVRSDLDQDGHVEEFGLVHQDNGQVDLRIKTNTGSDILLPNIAWKGGLYGQSPHLSLAPNGSVLLTSKNEGCCRFRWALTVTIANRQQSYRVAGQTYSWRDTLDLDAFGRCDVNFLTGRGFLENAKGITHFASDLEAAPLAEWSQDSALPTRCNPDAPAQ